MALAPGSRLGRFRILHRLGAGAMGEVYLAEDPQIERRVAIKTVRLAGTGPGAEEELRVRMAREAKAAGQLVHPHVVTLFDAGEAEGVFFLAFEYIQGTDLEVRARGQPPLTTNEVVRIGHQAASGLSAAHRRGIVHRDIKPSNLLQNEEGSVKISDFGIAKLSGQRTELTQLGTVIGTPQYLSPEQVRGESLDGRSDLFSLGIVLYELLARRLPFDGETFSTLLYQILSQEPMPLSELRPDLPPRLSNAVMKLLAKSPDERFPTADALRDELEAIERELEAAAGLPTAVLPEAGAPTRLVAREEPSPRTVLADESRAHRPRPADAAARSRSTTARSSRSRRRWAVLVGSIVLLLAGGATVATFVHRAQGNGEAGLVSPTHDETPGIPGNSTPPMTSTDGDEAGAARGADDAGSVSDPGASTMPSDEPDTADLDEYASSPRRQVAGALTFEITPDEAARRAVVIVDGLARGPAVGSLVTLQPGEHRVEIRAEGFTSLTFVAEVRPGAAAPSRVDLVMERE